ncbi:SSI family serine proteinase inhibitor [Planobispora takensis]|uniref:Subtilisin inhibitor domain-containing protein n=1 Tax=Planobispora takensis TaxID=1367882 RepID=A0A8J3T1C9_9ACTN|nr:SSI family serine proteinase inhibitor [Planobispora takensis]GII02626.1 hypothetical protein Pta02_46340 [Planobispora takensis]
MRKLGGSMRRLFALLTAGPVLLAGTALLSGTASAALLSDATARADRPGSWASAMGTSRPEAQMRAFTLAVAEGATRLSPMTSMSSMKQAVLRCHPDGGTHPRAASACGELERVGGDPSALDPASVMSCTMEYDPVTVLAVGTWDGQAFRYEETFGNLCSMYSETGNVFAF